MFSSDVEKIFERVRQRISEVETGFASGNPYVATRVDVSDVEDILLATEKLLAALYAAGVASPIMLDLKNEFIMVRFACNKQQKKAIEKVLQLP